MRFTYMAAVCAVAIAAAGCAARHASTASHTVVVTEPVQQSSAAPTATATMTPVATASAQAVTPSASPAATPEPTPSSPIRRPNAAPEIVGVQIDKTTVAPGDTVSGTIETSSNVASVEARIATYSISVPKVSPGRFALSYSVPNVPFFLRRTYDMVVIARNTEGDQTTRTIPITIH